MKLLLVIILSTITFANNCHSQLENRQLSDVKSHEDDNNTFYSLTAEGDYKITKNEFFSYSVFSNGFDIDSVEADEFYNDCKDAIKYLDFSHPITGNSFKAIYTFEDSCDGGNSFGLIKESSTNRLIAEIGDSEFYCL